MIVVHHLETSQSERAVWTCEELELPYELRSWSRDPISRRAPADLDQIHPMGLAPIICDGDVVLAESGAIVEFLSKRYGRGALELPIEDPDYADYCFWLHFANGTLVPAEIMRTIGKLAEAGSRAAAVAGTFGERAEKGFDLVERRLADSPFLAGDRFTAADIMMKFPLDTMSAFTGRSLQDRPHTRAYVDRLRARPAFQRAMARARGAHQEAA